MEWINALKRLDTVGFEAVKLKIEGHEVSYQNVMVNRKQVIMYFVDGWSKGEWSNKDSEIGQKFGRPVYYRVTAKEMALWVKLYGKKQAEKKKAEWKSKVILYHYRFNNATQVIKFLKSKKYQIEVIHEPADENM